jgi:hypothetical protein
MQSIYWLSWLSREAHQLYDGVLFVIIIIIIINISGIKLLICSGYKDPILTQLNSVHI